MSQQYHARPAKIGPSILSADLANLAAECRRAIEDWGAGWFYLGEGGKMAVGYSRPLPLKTTSTST